VDIYIPFDLPPTSAPCPHCRQVIMSPPPPAAPAILPPKKEIAESLPALQPALPAPEISHNEPPAPASKAPWFISIFLLVLIAAGSKLFYEEYLRFANASDSTSSQSPPSSINLYNRDKQARVALRSFLSATTLEDKARHVIGGQATLQRLLPEWGDKLLHEEPIHEEDFASIITGDEEGENPVFLLFYDRPSTYDIKKLFPPLMPMEVTSKLQPIDPLFLPLTDRSRFESEPLRINAFFKQTDDGVLLDWDIYLQTRYRTLRAFVGSAPAGKRSTFRVIALHDVPLPEEKRKMQKVYRLTDVANISDSFRVFTPMGSKAAESMSKIDWYGQPDKSNPLAPVTVVLEKLPDGGVLLAEHICWDFELLDDSEGRMLNIDAHYNLRSQTEPSGAPSSVPSP
jgi:hypothetical protein